MRLRGSRLRIEIAIEHADQRLRHIGDDQRAAGGTCCDFEFAVRPEHDGGGHGAHRPLAGRRRIGNRLSVHRGLEGKIRQLIVEEETLRHHFRAEDEFDRRGHRHHFAGIVHHRQVAGARKLWRALRGKLRFRGRRRACNCGSHVFLRVDQGGALREIGPVKQAGDRHMDRIGIAQILRAVGKRETLGFADEMQFTQAIRLQLGGRKALQHPENLQHRDAARARRPHGAHPVHAVGAAHRLPLHRLVGGKIGERHAAAIDGRMLHLLDDRLRDGTGIERLCAAACDCAQGLGKLRILQDLALVQGRAIGMIEVPFDIWHPSHVRKFANLRRHLAAHRKPAFRKRDRRPEQRRPRQLAILLVRQFQHREHARHTHG